jgi:HD-like signal output (HDOD) protein
MVAVIGRGRASPAPLLPEEIGRTVHELSAELAAIDSRAPMMMERVVQAVATQRLRTPLLPASALEILQLTSRRDVSFDLVARKAVQDPAVALTVMRIANSAAFSHSNKAVDIKDALVRIGIEGIREVAFDLAMSSKVARRGRFLPVQERLLRHARTTSALSRILARDLGVAPGIAALAGLLHASGGMVIVDEIVGQRDQKTVVDVVVYLLIRRLHPWVASVVVGSLDLDPSIISSLAGHHSRQLTSAPALTRLLAFVDMISPSEPAARVVPLDLAIERTGLGLSPREVMARLRPIISTVDEIRLSHLSAMGQ